VFSPQAAGKKASELFSRPRPRKLSDKNIAWLEDYKSGLIKVEGHACQSYHIKGKGPKILFAHGWESNAYRWRAYIQPFQESGYDIFMLDAPGHGLSPGKFFTPPLYAAAINIFGRQEDVNIIVGHSAGGYATMFACGQLEVIPSLQKLVLMAPTNRLEKLFEQFYAVLALNKKTKDSFKKQFTERFGGDFEYFSGYNLIQNIDVPGLLIHDEGDDVLPIRYSQELLDNWPKGEKYFTKGYGHRLMGDHMRDVIKDYVIAGKMPG